MSYLGQAALKNSELKRFDVTSSTSATHTLSWTAPNEQSLWITINGVKQQDGGGSNSSDAAGLSPALREKPEPCRACHAGVCRMASGGRRARRNRAECGGGTARRMEEAGPVGASG